MQGNSRKLDFQINQSSIYTKINHIYTPFKNNNKKAKEIKRLEHILSVINQHPDK